LTCQCGHTFSSSLCNADLKVKKTILDNNNLMPKIAEVREIESKGQIEILKKYNLRCLKCKNNAKFDNEELLDEFLRERVKQKLIFSFYKEKFAKFKSEPHSERVLEGHIQELCEKCQSLGRYCGEELIYQEQVSQIGYFPPFMKR
jgi:Zinc-binding domain